MALIKGPSGQGGDERQVVLPDVGSTGVAGRFKGS